MRRAHRYVLTALVVGALGSCQGGAEDRVDYPDDHVSLERITGWTEAHERGSLVFSDPSSRATIAIRTGDLRADDAPDLQRLTASTQAVLASLGSSQVQGPEPLEDTAMPGVLFEVSFVPHGRSETYARRHAVLLGERHFYHAILTAPEAELAAASDSFSVTVSSLREE